MEAALRLAVPVGLVRWKSNPVCFSPFVKVTYDLTSAGRAAIASEQQPISEGDVQSGRVIHPSDFAEAKGACEIALVGRVMAEHTGPGRIRVGALNREEARVGLLGAQNVGGPRAYFSTGANRMPFPALPLEVVVEGFGPTLRSTLPRSGPEMALVFGGAWAQSQAVPLFVDAVLIDPRKKRCSVVFRGYFSHPGDPDRSIVLVVDPLGQLQGVPAIDLEEWPRVRVVEEATEDDEEEDELTPPRGTPSGTVMMSATAIPGGASSRPATRVEESALVGDPTSTLPLGARSPIARGELPFRRSVATSGRAPLRPESPVSQSKPESFTAPLSSRSMPWETLPFVATGGRYDDTPKQSPLDDALPFAPPTGPRAVTFGPPPAAPSQPSQPTPVAPAPPPIRPLDAEDRTAPFVLPTRDARLSAASSAADSPPVTSTVPSSSKPPVVASVSDRSSASTSSRRPDPEEHTALFQLPTRSVPAALPFESRGPAPERASSTRPSDDDLSASAVLASALPFTAPAQPALLPYASTPLEVAKPADVLPPPPVMAVRLEQMIVSPSPAPPLAVVEPAWRPSPTVAAPGAIDKVEALTLDEYAALRAELWSGVRPRRDVLKARGLSELRWRAIERKWATEIDSMSADPHKLMRIVSRLQSFSDARSS